MKIGNLYFEEGIFLAPLAGVSDVAFRSIAGRYGAELTYTEMVSAKAIVYQNRNTTKLLDTSLDVKPVAVQLFGSEIDFIKEAILQIEEYPFCIVDFNMGCPVPKVVKNNEGSALLDNPKLVFDIINEAKKTTNKPVTIKIRKGYTKVNYIEIGKAAELAGADAIAIHGRTRGEYYSGNADWGAIAELKKSISIPVIGNGDVKTFEDYINIKKLTNCDAIMIGRGALGNPFIFEEINNKLKGMDTSITLQKRCEVLLEHAKLLIRSKDEFTAMNELRKQVAWYIHSIKNASKIRNEAMRISKIQDLENIIEKILNTE